MKKFVLLYSGFDQPSADRAAWHAWFAEVGDSVVDSGNPLGPGRRIAENGTTDLPVDRAAITAYSIIRAESLEQAERIAASCPAVNAVRVYEALPM